MRATDAATSERERNLAETRTEWFVRPDSVKGCHVETPVHPLWVACCRQETCLRLVEEEAGNAAGSESAAPNSDGGFMVDGVTKTNRTDH